MTKKRMFAETGGAEDGADEASSAGLAAEIAAADRLNQEEEDNASVDSENDVDSDSDSAGASDASFIASGDSSLDSEASFADDTTASEESEDDESGDDESDSASRPPRVVKQGGLCRSANIKIVFASTKRCRR